MLVTYDYHRPVVVAVWRPSDGKYYDFATRAWGTVAAGGTVPVQALAAAGGPTSLLQWAEVPVVEPETVVMLYESNAGKAGAYLAHVPVLEITTHPMAPSIAYVTTRGARP